MLPISNSEDRYDPICVRVPARSLLPALAGEAQASGLVPSSAFLLTRSSQTQYAPPSAQSALPRRLPCLSSRLSSLVGWKASICSGAALERGEKPPRSPQTREHRGLRLSKPAVRVLRHHR